MSLDIPPYMTYLSVVYPSIYLFIVYLAVFHIVLNLSMPLSKHFSTSSPEQLSRALLPAIPPPVPTSSHALGHN